MIQYNELETKAREHFGTRFDYVVERGINLVVCIKHDVMLSIEDLISFKEKVGTFMISSDSVGENEHNVDLVFPGD